VVLAGSIRAELERIAPRTARHVVAIDLPSVLGDLPADGVERPAGSLRFGFVGGGRSAKGFREFIDLAARIRRRHPEVVFEVIGSVPDSVPRSELTGLDWSSEKLPLTEFVRRLRRLSHVVWLGDPKHYRLVASGSLVDSIALGLPVVYLAGGFADYMFECAAAAGVRCESLDAVYREVLRLVESPVERGDESPAASAAAAARALAPETWAAHLRRAASREG
jgi:glycosyltransferase involved in cell wall biosynthesis